MEVIALEGDPNSGKTKTLNLVYALLVQAGYLTCALPIYASSRRFSRFV